MNEKWVHSLAQGYIMKKDQIRDTYELACLMDSNRLCSDLIQSLMRLNCSTSSHNISDGLYDKSQIAIKAIEDLAINIGISICNFKNDAN